MHCSVHNFPAGVHIKAQKFKKETNMMRNLLSPHFLELIFKESALRPFEEFFFALSPFFDASRNKNIGATIRIGQDIPCLPYAGFFILNY